MGKCDSYMHVQQMNASLNSQHCDIIMLLINFAKYKNIIQCLLNEKRYSKKENAIELYIEKPFK